MVQDGEENTEPSDERQSATDPDTVTKPAEKLREPGATLPEPDDFGLPTRPLRRRQYDDSSDSSDTEAEFEDAVESDQAQDSKSPKAEAIERVENLPNGHSHEADSAVEETRPTTPPNQTSPEVTPNIEQQNANNAIEDARDVVGEVSMSVNVDERTRGEMPPVDGPSTDGVLPHEAQKPNSNTTGSESTTAKDVSTSSRDPASPQSPTTPHSTRRHRATSSLGSVGPVAVSEWSHQQLAPQPEEHEEEEEDQGQWQEMPAFATHRIYDDWGKVLAKEYDEEDHEYLTYGTLGGAGKGYTRVQVDEDAQSATSLDDNTAYLFKEPLGNTLAEEDEETRDLAAQMQTTKKLLTEGQRIAYVGVVRIAIAKMSADIDQLPRTKNTRKATDFAAEATRMWGQKVMVRLYGHMEISTSEQVMVEQLTEHGVLPSDLAPALMQNARVANTLAEGDIASEKALVSSARPSMSSPPPPQYSENNKSSQSLATPLTADGTSSPASEAPPEYEERGADHLVPEDPTTLDHVKNIDLDIRWTVLCDLFLLLIADSTYDARSRLLLERVGAALAVDFTDICRFEKRVTDALEMQEQADKENWNEDEHLEARAKAAKRRRIMVMGLCTVGGGLIIGLSAGMLAPVIGAGFAAGFSTIGVAGTSTFFGGAGAAALIGTAGATTGSIVGVRASNRRTKAVKTFEYRPLFNNKHPNLIVSVAGWMTGNVDDVRLPFSTVNPVMGDIYSVNWEPDMLRSTGQTIQILATEALTQTIQQILGSTILTALMAGLNVPIVLTKLSYLVDNPWTVSLARADASGLILADSLIDRNLGLRPITLVGFSLGSRVIFSCLRELARKGAVGIVQNVYMFGSPVVVKQDEWIRARSVVAGRFVNGYTTNDWILGYLFRATSGGILRVSGLASVDLVGVENVDVTDDVAGHMAYRGMMPKLLDKVGWLMDSMEFSEIEDPDPENHDKRQRELIAEIEEARLELEHRETKKGTFIVHVLPQESCKEAVGNIRRAVTACTRGRRQSRRGSCGGRHWHGRCHV